MEHRSHKTNIVISEGCATVGDKCAGESATNVAQGKLREEKQVGGPLNCSDSDLSTYLRALAEGFLPTYYSDTSQCAQSKLMNIASKSYRKGKKTVSFHGFQSLEMSRSLTESRGEELLMLFREGFPAKTYPSQEKATGLTGLEAGCGWKWPGSLAKYDRDSRLWKTRQHSLLGGLAELSETWPRWGMTVDGELFPQQTLVRRISGKESGYMATPTAQSIHYSVAAGKKEAMRLHPNGRYTLMTLISVIESESKKYLSPEFVEWLMGWPEGWTDLKPLEMDKYRKWLELHGSY